MTRRTVLGRIWDRQQDRGTNGAQTSVRGEGSEQNLHEVRNATDARGESVRGGNNETRQRGESTG